jgi:hypothetical protein
MSGSVLPVGNPHSVSKGVFMLPRMMLLRDKKHVGLSSTSSNSDYTCHSYGGSSNNTSHLSVTVLDTGKLNSASGRYMLRQSTLARHEADVLFVDVGTVLYVYIGGKHSASKLTTAGTQERASFEHKALAYLTERKREHCTPIVRIIGSAQMTHCQEFHQLFY